VGVSVAGRGVADGVTEGFGAVHAVIASISINPKNTFFIKIFSGGTISSEQ